MKKASSIDFFLTPECNERLAAFCGQMDENLRFLEKQLKIKIDYRNSLMQLTGHLHKIHHAKSLIQFIYDHFSEKEVLSPEKIHLHIKSYEASLLQKKSLEHAGSLKIRHMTLKPHSDNQRCYIDKMKNHDINFAIGPSGTGKTYLAVALAVEHLQRNQVERLILVRPAIEAGESLGFLPGDLKDKVDPYLRPLYDALFEMMGPEKVAKLIDKNIIEIVPLAYMRGRTLNDSFIILDEGQNTTPQQMKMFLTRIGFGSKAVITGDVTQVDLPKHISSGLMHAARILKDISEISFTYFQSTDVVRHPLVQKMVEAYEQFEEVPA